MEQPATSPQAQGKPEAIGNKRRNWIEIGAAYALILAVEWTPRPLQRAMWVAAAVGIALILWRSFGGWAEMGFRVANLWRSLWIAAAALLVAGAVVLVALGMHTLLVPGGPFLFLWAYCAYAIWACAQQFLLQGFFLLRLSRVISGERQAALAAAALFAGAHMPNPFLVPVTLVWGVLSCLLFLRYRNLYPLMIAHAILGITVAMTVPGPVDHNMRVGLGYVVYRQHMHTHHPHH